MPVNNTASLVELIKYIRTGIVGDPSCVAVANSALYELERRFAEGVYGVVEGDA